MIKRLSRVLPTVLLAAIAAMPIAATAQVFGPPGVNSLPSISGWNSTLITASGCTIVKNRAGIFFGFQNVGVVSQPAGNATFYDSTNCTGKAFFQETQLGPGQIIPIGGTYGVTAFNGISVNCTAAPSGTNLLGILVMYE